MEKKVTVLTPNGRRQNIKVTPNTTLLQVLEEACQKHGFDSDEYGLKHHNKEIDLTQMFRFSGLPNNCLLEMSKMERKRVPMNVDICIQLEDGSRKQGQFKPSDSLWTVVEQLAPAASSFLSPVAIYMRREIIGKDSMENTTLKSLGITEGRAMIRFIDKDPNELKTQANVYKAPEVKPFPKTDSAVRRNTGSSGGGGGGFAITKNVVESLKKTAVDRTDNAEPEEMDTTEPSQDTGTTVQPKYDWGPGSGRTIRGTNTESANELNRSTANLDIEREPEMKIIGERNAILFSLDAIQKHIEDLPDSFFDLTVHDLKLVLRDLKKVANGDEDAPLLTEKLRQLEENKTMLNKIGQYKSCVIRVQFPDRLVLQGTFKPIDTIASVVEFVRKFLLDSNAQFHLFTIPPKIILPLDKTLLELDCVPNALVHFGLDVDTSTPIENYVKPELMDSLTTIEGAFFAANKFRLAMHISPTETNTYSDSAPLQYEPRPPGPSTGAIPKRRRNIDENI